MVMAPEWEGSKGCSLERARALEVGIVVMGFEDICAGRIGRWLGAAILREKR